MTNDNDNDPNDASNMSLQEKQDMCIEMYIDGRKDDLMGYGKKTIGGQGILFRDREFAWAYANGFILEGGWDVRVTEMRIALTWWIYKGVLVSATSLAALPDISEEDQHDIIDNMFFVSLYFVTQKMMRPRQLTLTEMDDEDLLIEVEPKDTDVVHKDDRDFFEKL